MINNWDRMKWARKSLLIRQKICFCKIANSTDLSFLALSPLWQRTYLLLISNPFFCQKVNRSKGPYIIETVRKILALMTSCLFLFLRCSFRIIFILIRYVAIIVMKALYDEALFKIAFKTLLRFSAGINLLSYSVHVECSSR